MKILGFVVIPTAGVMEWASKPLLALPMFCFCCSVAIAEIHFVPNVFEQFTALSKRPDALGFYKGDSPNPSRCKHYQGMVRYQGDDNTPYFIISRSGNTPPIPHLPDGISCGELNGGDDDDPGNLLVIRMGSREKHGERMRSNRIRKGTETADTPPDSEDKLATYITFDGTDGWPNYGHPGGMQIVGDVVAVPMETPYPNNNSFPEARILFIDVSTPSSPQLVNQFDPDIEGMKAGLLGLTPQASGKYLMLISGGTNETIWFYESVPNNDNGTPDNLDDDNTDLKSPGLDWTLVDTWTKAEDEADVGADWPIEGGAHQSLTFLREGGIDGQLYVAGARNTVVLQYFGSDHIDLYRVVRTGNDFKLHQVATSHKNTHPNSDGSITLPETPLNDAPTTANFATASTFYVSPSGELLFYATEHENDGPSESILFGGTIKAGEWRHIDMARANSPTRSPTARTNGPYSVNEGSSVAISGMGGPAISKAWIQLYSNRNFSDRYVVFDYTDRFKDNFGDFKDLDGDLLDLKRGFDNIPSSWNWFAPMGCTIRANDDSFGDSDFPGTNTRTLYGEGNVKRENDLHDVCNDEHHEDGEDCSGNNGQMDDELTSVEFFTNCDSYYGAELQFAWDLDLDNSIDTYGASTDYSAAELDGPDIQEPLFLVIHPDDDSTGRAYAKVTVNNVPPSIESFSIYDALGLEIGVDIPFVFVNLGLMATGGFTDPGKPDTQAATIDWDDSIVDPSTVFDVFTDASGGVTGRVEHQHIYSTTGTYSVHLNIIDDDGGSSDVTLEIKVASPTDAIEFVVDELDQIRATAADPEYRAAILDVRNNLDGNNYGAADNGALDKLESEEPQSALTMIEAALESLQRAEIEGSIDLAYMMDILGLTAEAITQFVYLDAVAATGTPSRGEAKQLQRIQQSITDGHTLLLSGDHLAAIEKYQSSVARANKLLT